MRRGLALPGALLLALAPALALAACAAGGPVLRVPETELPLSASPPSLPRPPATGPADSASSRDVTLVVSLGDRRVSLRAWCRVGVWTTLQQVRPREFVTRAAWGRLGDRPPRLLVKVKDQTIDGVIARLRPEADGSLSFLVEVSETEMKASRTVDIYRGQRVLLGHPVRRGYRLKGRAPPGWSGPVARWGDAVAVAIGEEEGDTPPPGALLFFAEKERGFVAGEAPAAEAFAEEWNPAEPFRFDGDGVERVDYRLEKKRSAAGFVTGREGGPQSYGPPFRFQRHE